MKKIVFFLLIFLSFTGCATKKKIDNINVDFKFSEKINSFTENVFTQIYVPEKNTAFSGSSVYNLLYLMSKATAGESAAEINKVLQLDDETFESVIPIFSSLENNTNSIWIDKNLSVKNSYSVFCKKLNSKIFSVNFADSKNVTKKINQFIKKSTKNEIPQFLKDDLSSATKLCFLNTLYFNQKWEKPFPEDKTSKSDFYISSDKTTSVKMMHNSDDYNYFEDDDFQIIQFDYKNSDYSMICILPKTDDYDFSTLPLCKLLLKFDEEKFNTSVQVSFPKFNSDVSTSLKEVLINLGIKNIFSYSADFSNICDNSENIFVDEILHETKVTVDEKKTKAVAVTLSMVKSAGPISEYFFNCNHPFCYIIKDNSNNLILFTGVVNNPNE